MLLSALLRHPQCAERLTTLCPSTSSTLGNSIQVPSITRLQSAIEEAWKLGFDQQVSVQEHCINLCNPLISTFYIVVIQGCEQLGGKLSGTCKWIGATEIATLLASCHIR